MKHLITVLMFSTLSLTGCWILPDSLLPGVRRQVLALPVTDSGFTLEIRGDAYFSFVNESGQIVLSREGSFRFDTQHRVTAPNGFPLEPPIQVPGGSTIIEIRADGTVFGGMSGQTEVAILGNILLTKVKDPSTLRSLGNGFLLPTGRTETNQPTLDDFPGLM